MKIASGPPGFSSLFMTHQNRADHTFWPHLRKNNQKMKTEWTTHSWNNAIWLALRLCYMTMMRKINKLEKPGGPQGNFHTLFGRSPTFYGHFRVDVLTSEWSTCISSSFISSSLTLLASRAADSSTAGCKGWSPLLFTHLDRTCKRQHFFEEKLLNILKSIIFCFF